MHKKILFIHVFLIILGYLTLISIKQAIADQGNIAIIGRVLPGFQIAFDNNTAKITTNMKVVVNGKEIKQ